MKAFYLVIFLILSVGYSYLYMSLIDTAPLTLGLKFGLGLLLAVPVLAVAWLPLIYWRNRDRGGCTLRMLAVAHFSMSFLSFLLAGALVRDLILVPLCHFTGCHHNLRAPYINLSIVAIAALAWLVGNLNVKFTPRVRKVKIPLPQLPKEFENFRIVQISDLHISFNISENFIRGVVDKVNALQPDIVVLTGDIGDGPASELRAKTDLLGELSAKIGKFYCTGNHEYYTGVEAWIAEMKRVGIKPLVNTFEVLEKDGEQLVIAGAPDYAAGASSVNPQTLIEKTPASKVRILLAHQPKLADRAADAGFDLQISGHTHGGQFVPWTFVIYLFQPYVAGLHRIKDKLWLYVSRGTGYWGPPVRLGSPSEISLLLLANS